MNFFFSAIVCFGFSSSLICQTNEVGLKLGGELPTRSWFATKLDNFNKFEHEKVRSLAGFSVEASFSRHLHKRFDIYANAFLRYGQQRYYQPILEQSGTQVAEIAFALNRFDCMLGAFKRFRLFDGKLRLDVGVNIGKRAYINDGKSFTLESESPTVNDWIKHTYNLQTFQSDFYDNDINILRRFRGFVEFEVCAGLSFELSDRINFLLNSTFAPNHYTFYDLSYSLIYYQNGSPTPTGSYNFVGFTDDTKFVVKDHMIRTNLGISVSL